MTSELNPVERELQKATGVKPKDNDKRQDYLRTLFIAADDMSQEAWDRLSDPAQLYVNRMSKSYKNGKPYPDFPAPEPDRPIITKPVHEEPEKRAGKPVTLRLRELVVKHPNLTLAEARKKLGDIGKISQLSINTIYSDTRVTLRLAAKFDKLKYKADVEALLGSKEDQRTKVHRK